MYSLICILGAIGLFIFLFLWYSGIMYDPKVSVIDGALNWRMEIYYKIGRGDHCSCPVYYQEMKDIAPMGIRIGIFYDNPKIVRCTNLRWIIGVVTTINGQQLISDSILERLRRYRCSSIIIPAVDKAIVTEYPCKTFLSLWLARRKVASKIEQFQKDTALAGRPLIEIFKDDHVRYFLPLRNHDAYVVPEFKSYNF